MNFPYRWKYKRKDIADKDVHFLTQKSSYILLIIPFKHNLETSSKCICLGAEFKEFEPRLKFKLRIKDGWFQLKLYSLLQDLSRGSIETGFWRITDEAQIHYTWTFILCVFWVYFECILSVFWVYFECILKFARKQTKTNGIGRRYYSNTWVYLMLWSKQIVLETTYKITNFVEWVCVHCTIAVYYAH